MTARESAYAATRSGGSPLEDWISDYTSTPVEIIEINRVSGSYSPRQLGIDETHVRLMVQSPLPLPPITVHRSSMRVIDGMHRLRAARLRGERFVQARMFDGVDSAAFALAVHSNVTHGLPLTLRERKQAAQTVLDANPEWSDRWIALITGLSGKTVGKLRAGTTAEESQSYRRGHDGRCRPIDAARGRQRAAHFLMSSPGASLRTIAREAGISIATARDVRGRIEEGQNPLPDRLAGVTRKEVKSSGGAELGSRGPQPVESTQDAPSEEPSLWAMRSQALLQRLNNDPAVRSSEKGRNALRLFAATANTISACYAFVDMMPAHCADTVADLAKRNAHAWQELERLVRARKEQSASQRPRAI